MLVEHRGLPDLVVVRHVQDHGIVGVDDEDLPTDAGRSKTGWSLSAIAANNAAYVAQAERQATVTGFRRPLVAAGGVLGLGLATSKAKS